jgi:lambda repressor-like predicted transcriptional regulator
MVLPMSKSASLKKSATQIPLHDWHRADIKAALEKAGWTIRRLSAEYNYKGGGLHNALATPWPKAQAIIAAAIGVTPQTIWPSRYNADGSPKMGQFSQKQCPKNNTARRAKAA